MQRLLTGIAETVLAGDKLEQDIGKWLSPPDPWKNHNIACKSRHRASAAWFVQGNRFSDWKVSKVPGSLLWVHGKRTLTPDCTLFQRMKFNFYRSGCRKERTLVRQIFDIADSSLSPWPAPQLSRTSMPCGKRDLRHWRSTVILGKIKRRTCVDYSRPSWSNFVINPTPIVISFPNSTQTTPMVRVIPAMMHLRDV